MSECIIYIYILGHLELIRCFGSLHSSVPGSVGRSGLFIYLFFILVAGMCIHVQLCISNSFSPSSGLASPSRSNLTVVDPA